MEKNIESRKTFTVLAPARVCLFGEHQDYLNLPVIAAPISRYMKLEVVKTTADFIDIKMIDLKQSRRIHLNDAFEPLEPRDYIASVMRVLRKRQCLPSSGATVSIASNIPINAGASSSSALTIGWATVLLELAGKRSAINSRDLGLIGYEAEVLEHQEPGGMMDQISIASSGVIHIDTQSYSVTPLRNTLPGLLLAESLEPKQTLEVLKNIKEPVLQAFQTIAAAQPLNSIKALTLPIINAYCSENSLKNVSLLKAAVRNYKITREALPLLQQKIVDIERIGQLMYAQHRILADDLKLSTPKIERMISAALEAGAYGAKINGSGGGGTIVIIAPQERSAEISEAVNAVGGKAYSVDVDKGARITYDG
ncbi:MAG: galactokinase family protein [Calditrichia bacterium]